MHRQLVGILQTFMDTGADVFGATTRIQARHPVGMHVGKTDITAETPAQTIGLVDGGFASYRLEDAGFQFGSNALVGVDHEYPVTTRQRFGAPALFTKTLPVCALGNLGAAAPGNITGGVAAAGIEHHDLVRPRQARQAFGNLLLFVSDYQDRRNGGTDLCLCRRFCRRHILAGYRGSRT
jgi:hypothetical protein